LLATTTTSPFRSFTPPSLRLRNKTSLKSSPSEMIFVLTGMKTRGGLVFRCAIVVLLLHLLYQAYSWRLFEKRIHCLLLASLRKPFRKEPSPYPWTYAAAVVGKDALRAEPQAAARSWLVATPVSHITWTSAPILPLPPGCWQRLPTPPKCQCSKEDSEVVILQNGSAANTNELEGVSHLMVSFGFIVSIGYETSLSTKA